VSAWKKLQGHMHSFQNLVLNLWVRLLLTLPQRPATLFLYFVEKTIPFK